MSKKIFISPSNQFANLYNGVSTNEGTQMGLLAQLVQTRLNKAGFETLCMHDHSMQEKCAAADKWGADLYICLHSNACNKTVSGTHIFYWSKDGIGYKCGVKVFEQLAPFCPGTNDKMVQDRTLYEIKTPKAPCVYIEVDFHDVKTIAIWMVDHLPEIADKIVTGVCNYYGVPAPGRKYSVCFGQYTSYDAANAAAQTVKVIEEA